MSTQEDSGRKLSFQSKITYSKGKNTGKTVRKHNFQNEQALGKKAYQKLSSHGTKMGMKKNFHKGLGSGSMKMRKDIDYQLCNECDDGIYDHYEEEWEEMEDEFEKERETLKEENSKFFCMRKMFEEVAPPVESQ